MVLLVWLVILCVISEGEGGGMGFGGSSERGALFWEYF